MPTGNRFVNVLANQCGEVDVRFHYWSFKVSSVGMLDQYLVFTGAYGESGPVSTPPSRTHVGSKRHRLKGTGFPIDSIRYR